MTKLCLDRIHLSKPHLSGEESAAIQRVLDSNMVAPVGPILAEFEQALTSYTGINHAVALSSGTAALHLAMDLLGIKPGDEIWCPSLTFIASISGAVQLGAKPRFFDTAPGRWTLDLVLIADALESARRARALPKAIVCVDLYGQPAPLAELAALGQEYGVPIIADSAEALGAWHNQTHAGKGALMTALSFNGNKIITTSGGGAVLSDDPDLTDQALKLATQAKENQPHYEHLRTGYNYRMSGVCAAIGLAQVDVLKQRVDQRRAVYQAYKLKLSDRGLCFFNQAPKERASHWLSVALLERSDPQSLIAYLEALNIEARRIWKPMHLQPAFHHCAIVHRQAEQPLCQQVFDKGVCLPSCSQFMENESDDFNRVLNALDAYFS